MPEFVPPWQDFAASALCLAFIKREEGYSPEVYRDGPTSRAGGWGHQTVLAVGFKPGKKYWETAFKRDVQAAENCLRKHVRVPLTQNQVDALISFIFNVGCAAFAGSTMLARLNVGDYAAAQAEFQRWNHVDGQVSIVLTGRRHREETLFAA